MFVSDLTFYEQENGAQTKKHKANNKHNFQKVKDNVIFRQKEDDLKIWQIKDNLNFWLRKQLNEVEIHKLRNSPTNKLTQVDTC
jgi:hypothetical protein